MKLLPFLDTRVALTAESPLVANTSCDGLHTQQCHIESKTLILISISLGITLVYFVLYGYFLLAMVQQLRSLTYQAHKINNLLVRLQVSSNCDSPQSRMRLTSIPNVAHIELEHHSERHQQWGASLALLKISLHSLMRAF